MTALFPGLAKLVKTQYGAATKNGAIQFVESEVEDLGEEGVTFESRLLERKPKPTGTTTEKRADPFAEPYEPELFVAHEEVREAGQEKGDSFVVLLNKFPVIPRHFLLCTKEFVPQQRPLSPTELLATYSILKQLGTRERHLALFNCGAASGSSQPHKHIQFIPLANGVAPFDTLIAANRPQNIKACFQIDLPYANFTAVISPPPSATADDLAGYLANLFMSLLDLMIDHLRRLALNESEGITQFKLSQLSYNVIITLDYIHLVPRLKERFEREEKSISINALGFAGMMLFKDPEALALVQRVGAWEVLKELGFPPVAAGEAELEEES